MNLLMNMFLSRGVFGGAMRAHPPWIIKYMLFEGFWIIMGPLSEKEKKLSPPGEIPEYASVNFLKAMYSSQPLLILSKWTHVCRSTDVFQFKNWPKDCVLLVILIRNAGIVGLAEII